MKPLVIIPLLKVLFLTSLLAPLALAGPGERRKDAAAGSRPDKPGGGRLVQGMQQVTGELSLSAEQQTKVDAIINAVPAQMRELAEQTQDMDPRDRAGRVRELLAETRTAIEAELTAEQKAVFTEKLDAAAAQRKERRAQRNADPNADPNAGQAQSPDQNRRPRQQGQQPGAQMIERMETAIAQLNLSAEQKTQADKVITELKAKLQDIRANANGDVEAARTEAREAFVNARKEIGQTLDQEQRQKLRELMQAEADKGQPGAKSGERPNRRDRPDMQDQNAKPQPGASPPTTAPSTRSNTKPAADAAGLAVLAGSLTRIGELAPEIQLVDLSGKSIVLRSLVKSRPLVVVTGSYTSPAFRDRVPDMRDMKRTLAGKVDLCIVYVAEAHPAGEWDIERNRDAGISVTAHQSKEDRLAAANKAKKQLDLDVTLVVDDMPNTFLTAANNRPNAAVLLDRGGTILLFQNWFEPHALRRAVDELRS